jgi:DNA modification methylase
MSVALEPSFAVGCMDAVAWLRMMADASVDLLITDPAYESLEKHRAIGTTTRLKHSKASSNQWFSIFPNQRFAELFVEAYRVLKKNSHFYLFCDHETAFIAKPIAEQAGFKFWKPIVWDKCLGPDTPVWTTRGVIPLAHVRVGDTVATPSGDSARVRAVRQTRAPAMRITFTDGTAIVASHEHRFVRADGEEVLASQLRSGDALMTAAILEPVDARLAMRDLIAEEDAVYELRDPRRCLWCDREFPSIRAAAAHQARFCEHARSKADMAQELGVGPKRLRRWLSSGQVPARWARELNLDAHLTRRVRLYLQNDQEHWYPESIPLDYRWGKLIGLFAAEGSYSSIGISFALHASEKHLQAHIARLARIIGARAQVWAHGENGAGVTVGNKLFASLMRHFVGGRDAVSKHLLPTVYTAPPEFQRGVFDGLLEGDGHWANDEQRETFVSASLDLAMFVHRHALLEGHKASIRRFENSARGGWKVRFDPGAPPIPMAVHAIEELGHQELHDIAIDDCDELFLLGNGLVTHNCRIGLGYHYRAQYELVLFFEKGKRKLTDLGVADIIKVPRVHRGYPAEKPVAVSEVLVRQSSAPGELIVDPFCGSGSVGVAAVTLGRDFMGCDVCGEAVAITRQRLIDAGARERPRARAELDVVRRGEQLELAANDRQ